MWAVSLTTLYTSTDILGFSASLTTWTTQLSTLEARAAEHDRYSSELLMQIAEPLKVLAGRYEDLRKSHAEYAGRLERERDVSYSDLRKQKGRYDGVCQEVENRRRKTETAFDHGKGKAQNAYQQQMMEMHNVKVGKNKQPAAVCFLTYTEHLHHQH